MENLKKEIRKYNTGEVLIKMEEITKKMFLEDNPRRKINKKFDLAAWDISEVIYYLIKFSNDHRGKREIDEKDIFYLTTITRELLEKNFLSNLESLPSGISKLTYISHGFSQRQFLFQENYEIIWKFYRNAEILENIAKQHKNNLRVDEVINEIFEFSVRDFNMLLFILTVCLLKNKDITSVKYIDKITPILPNVNSEKVIKIIEYFASNYEEYRENPLEEMGIHVKPIVRTSKNKLVTPNFYILFKQLADGLYWVIKNYHKNKKPSNLFPREFGGLFEKYVENLLNHYLDKNTFVRLEETKKHKIADWKIETEKYIFLIEQKSSVGAIKTKNITFKFEELNPILNIYRKAINQLDITEKCIIPKTNKKKILKMILYYDYLPTTQALKELLRERMEKSKEEFENFFFIGISEFEILISLLGKDNKLFNRIIDEKIWREQKKDFEKGTDFNSIFREWGVESNDYMENFLTKKLNYFKDNMI